MKLSKELKNHLEALDIRIYTTTSNKTIIGECLEVLDNGIEIGRPLVISNFSLLGDDISYMTELVQENDSNSAVIFNTVIETESFACISLKKKYVDSLLEIKIADLLLKDLDELENGISNYSVDDKYKYSEPKEEKEDTDFTDCPFNKRWKGYMN